MCFLHSDDKSFLFSDTRGHRVGSEPLVSCWSRCCSSTHAGVAPNCNGPAGPPRGRRENNTSSSEVKSAAFSETFKIKASADAQSRSSKLYWSGVLQCILVVVGFLPFEQTETQRFCLRPSEEHLKADYITTGSLSQSEAPPDAPSAPCFWRMHRYDPSQPHISQDSLHIQKRRKKERKWRHGVV